MSGSNAGLPPLFLSMSANSNSRCKSVSQSATFSIPFSGCLAVENHANFALNSVDFKEPLFLNKIAPVEEYGGNGGSV